MENRMITGVFGDSFGSLRPEWLHNTDQDILPWPIHLSKLLNSKVITFANTATGLWWAYERFLQNYKKCATVVFCYTDHNRWATIQNPINSNEVLGLSNVRSKEQLPYVPNEHLHIAALLVELHPYVFNEALNLFMYQHIFDSINTICRENDIKLVNIMSFQNCLDKPLLIDISKSYGSCLTNLLEISQHEMSVNDEIVNQIRIHNESNPDMRFCHINPHNNKVLSVIIKEALEKHIPHKNIFNDTRLSYDSKHLKYLIK